MASFTAGHRIKLTKYLTRDRAKPCSHKSDLTFTGEDMIKEKNTKIKGLHPFHLSFRGAKVIRLFEMGKEIGK